MPYRDATAMVNDYIKRFGAAVCVELHPLDADGYTDVRHGAIVIGINVYLERNVILILARMGKLPEHNAEALYRKLNFLATRSCCFAVDEQRKRVYLRAMRSLDALDYAEFADLLETVASVAETMRSKLPELSD